MTKKKVNLNFINKIQLLVIVNNKNNYKQVKPKIIS